MNKVKELTQNYENVSEFDVGKDQEEEERELELRLSAAKTNEDDKVSIQSFMWSARRNRNERDSGNKTQRCTAAKGNSNLYLITGTSGQNNACGSGLSKKHSVSIASFFGRKSNIGCAASNNKRTKSKDEYKSGVFAFNPKPENPSEAQNLTLLRLQDCGNPNKNVRFETENNQIENALSQFVKLQRTP